MKDFFDVLSLSVDRVGQVGCVWRLRQCLTEPQRVLGLGAAGDARLC